MSFYPIFVTSLEHDKTVLIGGDEEAERKLKELLEVNANISLIADSITPEMHQLVKEYPSNISYIPRRYKYGDLEGARLVIVADFEGNENEFISEEADERGILVNVMDDIPHSNFAFGSLIKRGPLTVSISTSGAAPALAVRFRQKIEQIFGEEHGQFLEFAQKLRDPMKAHYSDFQERKERWYNLVDSNVIELIREGREEEAYKKAGHLMGKKVVDEALNRTSSEEGYSFENK